jgi:hypothetical protein
VITAGFAVVAGAIVAAVYAFRPREPPLAEPASIASAHGDLSVPTLTVLPRIEPAKEEERTPAEPASSTEPASSIELPSRQSPATARSAPIAAPSARPPTLPTSAPAATAQPPKAAAKPPALPAKKAKIDLPADPG